ncbi:MAG: dynamin family protein [Alistipes sp.]|nr:dynamin family protein [Alistipes sp.]
MDDLRNNPAPEWVQNIKTAFANLIVKVKEHDDFVTTIEQSDKALLSQQNEELLKRNKRAERDIEDLQIELEEIEEETRAKEKKAQKQILDSIKQQELTQEELLASQRQCAEKENSLKDLTRSMNFMREILSAKVASDSGTKTLYKRIEDLAEFISIDLFDSIKHLRVLKLINTTIDDRFFKEWLSRWIVNERKNWIKNKTTIAFVGEFSSGKTSIINLILTNGHKGKNLLSVDNSVTTAIPTYISNASEEKYRFFSSDEKLKEISKETFYSIDKKVIDRIGSLSSLVKYFVMTYNNPGLTAISILDTPGFSSNDEEDGRRTISVINECDALFWVIDVNAGEISASSVKTLREHLKKDLYIILNKIDTKSIQSVNDVKKKVENTLKDNNIKYKEVILFSKETSDIKDILNIVKAIEHNDDQDAFLLNIIAELDRIIGELETKVFELQEQLNEKNIELIKIRGNFENALTFISDASEDTSDLPTLKERFFGSDYYKMTKEQYKSFSNHLTTIQKYVDIANDLFDKMSHNETAKESYNSQYVRANNILQKLKDSRKDIVTQINNLYNE